MRFGVGPSVVWVLLTWLLASCVSEAGSGLALQTIMAGNERYRDDRPQDALASYREALESGNRSAGLYYNIASAAFRTGQRGMALAALELARDLAPRDPNVVANLRFVRGQQGPSEEGRWGTWHDGVPGADLLSPREFFLMLSGALSLFLLLLVLARLPVGSKQVRILSVLRLAQLLFALLALYSGLGFWAVTDATRPGSRAYVLSPAASLRADASAGSLELFEVRQDTRVRVLESLPADQTFDSARALFGQGKATEDSHWYRVEAADGATGWLPARDLIVF